jgi:Uma2 family endonuclease
MFRIKRNITKNAFTEHRQQTSSIAAIPLECLLVRRVQSHTRIARRNITMAILERERELVIPTAQSDLHRHLFTRDEFYALDKIDAFRDKRLELIEGEIIDMSPIGPSHATVIHPLAAILEGAFGQGFVLRHQVPVSLGGDAKPSDPQPDVTVATGSWRDYASHHPGPTEIVLIVEVADSTLDYDRKIKGRLYAAAGIPEYWVLNLNARRLEVYRNPGRAGYRSTTIYHETDSVEPLSAQGKRISVADFMP